MDWELAIFVRICRAAEVYCDEWYYVLCMSENEWTTLMISYWCRDLVSFLEFGLRYSNNNCAVTQVHACMRMEVVDCATCSSNVLEEVSKLKAQSYAH